MVGRRDATRDIQLLTSPARPGRRVPHRRDPRPRGPRRRGPHPRGPHRGGPHRDGPHRRATSPPRTSPARASPTRISPARTSPARTSPASGGRKEYRFRKAGYWAAVQAEAHRRVIRGNGLLPLITRLLVLAGMTVTFGGYRRKSQALVEAEAVLAELEILFWLYPSPAARISRAFQDLSVGHPAVVTSSSERSVGPRCGDVGLGVRAAPSGCGGAASARRRPGADGEGEDDPDVRADRARPERRRLIRCMASTA